MLALHLRPQRREGRRLTELTGHAQDIHDVHDAAATGRQSASMPKEFGSRSHEGARRRRSTKGFLR